MATTIAIICTLDELTPYSLADRTKRYFSLHWSVALRGDAALPPTAATNLFQPWMLYSGAAGHPVPPILPVLFGDNLAAGAAPNGALIPFQLIDAPSSDAGKVGTLLSAEYTAAVNAKVIPYFSWPDEPDATRPVNTATSADLNWSRVLAHASTYTAPLPKSLNLAVHFAVKVSDLTVAGNAITRLFAAPALQVDAATLLSPSPQPSGVDHSTVTYPYASTIGGLAVAAYHPEFVLTTLPAAGTLSKPHFIDLNTYWVGTEDGTDQVMPPESLVSDDWRTSLEFKAGDEFDLSQRLIVCLRALFFPVQADTTAPVYHPLDAAHPTFDEVNTISDAVLAALHDTADSGLRYGPDGTNLIRYLLQRTSPAFDPVSVENTLLKATTNTMVQWKQLILDQFNIDLKIPGVTGSQPATGDYVRTVLDTLDTVQKKLSTDATLAPLLVEQWTLAVKSVDPTQVSTWVAAVGSLIIPSAATIQPLPSRALRSRMLLSNMGGQETKGNDPKYPVDPSVPIWTALTTTTAGGTYETEKQTVTASLQALLAAYFQGRFGITSTDHHADLFVNRNPPASWPGTATVPLADLSQALKDDAFQFATKILFPPGIQVSRGSHPIIVQVDDTSDDPTEQEDDARKIAGYGLLLREGNGLWTCPNMANLYIDDSATPFKVDVPIPLRLTKRNNLKQPVLIYNSASMVTQDNNEKASSDFHHTAQYPDPAINDFTQMFSYKADVAEQVKSPTLDPDPANPNCLLLNIPAAVPPSGDNLLDWMRIPALKFGSTYTMLPFVIGNGGALPPLLTGDAAIDIFTPITPKAFGTAWQQTGLKGYLRQVTYKRRGAVGSPRHVPLRTPQTDTISLPVFPDTVIPLARDLKGNSGDVQPPILLLWGDSANTPGAVRSFSFSLRPPSCDMETWDRWVAGLGPNYNNTRIAVATGVGLGSLKDDSDVTILSAQNRNGPDLTLDDPAVQSLTISVTCLYPDPAAAPAVLPVTLDLAPPAALPASIAVSKADIVGSLLKTAQSNMFPITCAIDTGVSLKPSGTGVQVTLPEGQIWQIDVKPNIPDADVTNKFEGPAAVARGATFSLIVEAATAGIFAPRRVADQNSFQQQLWQNLSVSFAAPRVINNPDGTFKEIAPATLSASLNRWDDAVTNTARDLIHKVDLRRQQWRWRGRPLPAVPLEWSTVNPDLDAVPAMLPSNTMNSRLWEVALFGERPDDDCAIKTGSVNFAASASPATALLFSADLTSDPRASYERFGLDVHSRYEGLPGLTLAPIRGRMLNNDNAYTRWKRAIVTPRVRGIIPKPKIVLVIPLTEPDGSDTTAILPGLLAIANESAFALGGLAEELHCELDLARDPAYPLSIPTLNANPIPEIGPNTILSAGMLGSNNFMPGAPVLPANPIGTTFDQSSSASLYSSTCYRIHAPMVHSDGATPYQGALSVIGLEHYQARVRFRRAIKATSFNGAGPDLFSDATDAVAVEFQPSFHHCLLEGVSAPVSFDELKFRIEAGIVKAYQKDVAVTLQAGPPQNANLELWVLVLQQITDATGKKGTQMLALDLLSFNAASTIVTADSSDHIFYVLEVLCTKNHLGKFTSGIPNAATMLFNDPNLNNRLSTDVLARIQRCSPSIGHYAG